MQSFAVVPAAGLSRRMGQAKLLLPWGQGTVLSTVLAAWQQGGVDQVWMVISPASPDRPQLEQLAHAARAHLVVPAHPPRDMRASIQAALSAIDASQTPGATAAWLVAPADLPQLSPSAVANLLQQHRGAPTSALVATFAGRRGHPVLLPWSWAAQLAGLPDEMGLNSLVARGPTVEVACDGDTGLADDMDTAEAYQRLRNRYDRPGP